MHKPQRPAVVYDGERLAKQTYLTAPEAAWYLGYTAERHGSELKAYRAFHRIVTAHAIPRLYLGRSLRFLRRDLDRLLIAAPALRRSS